MVSDPFALFDEWFAQARASELNDPEAMALATADISGRPSVRMVLLKGHGPGGFVFYTNQGSAKAEQLASNPWSRPCSSTGSLCGGKCGLKAGSSRSAMRTPTLISPAAPGTRSWVPGLLTNHAPSTAE